MSRRSAGMSLIDRLFGRRRPGPGLTPVEISDARYDDWEVVSDFAAVETARAYHQHLSEAGFECVLTSDWPLDRFGRGDISLRVPAGRWSAAEEFLSGLDE